MKVDKMFELAQRRKDWQKIKNSKALLKEAKRQVKQAAFAGHTNVRFLNEVFVNGCRLDSADPILVKEYFEQNGFKVELEGDWKNEMSRPIIEICWDTFVRAPKKPELKITTRRHI